MSTPDSLQQNPLTEPDASTKMKKNTSSRKSADLKTLFQSEPFSFTFPTLIHPEEPSRVIRAETDARPCSELCPAVVGSCCSRSLPLVPPSSGIMFRVDHDDKRTLSLHCPDSVAPGSSVTLYERQSTGQLSLFESIGSSSALIVGPQVTSNKGSSGSKKGHKMKVDSNGILIWKHKTPYTVEWIEGFEEGKDLDVTYVEGIGDVPVLLANKEGLMKEATIGGEVRLSNGTKFRNPRQTPCTKELPWILDAEQKDPVQRDLMMKDPREGAADQLVGWAAPLSDVKRYEAKMKSGETQTCVCHSVAAVVCCPCFSVSFFCCR